MFVEGCFCSTYTDSVGFGNCKKKFQKGPICYVHEPSNCQDLQANKPENGKRYSWEACRGPPPKDEIDDELLQQLGNENPPMGTLFIFFVDKNLCHLESL